MATAQQYLEKAASYIGVRGTDNIFNTWFWGHHCYDPGTYPWCAAFQSYVGVHDLGMDFTPSASAAGVANQGTRVPDEQAQPGDWVLFNWDGRQDWGWADHIGVVEWSDINGSGYFGTIEGNTGSSAGGEVARCTRYNWGSYGTAFFRPRWGGGPSPSPSPQPSGDENGPRFAVCSNGFWYDDMFGTRDTGGSSDNYGGELGHTITYLAIDGVGKYRVCTAMSGWLPYVDRYDRNDEEYGMAGDGSSILAIEIPNEKVRFACHSRAGGWLPDMIGQYDTGGSSDRYGGDMTPIDAVRIQWA